MAKKKVCFFSIADANNMKYFKRMEKSLRKFYPSEQDFPLLLWDERKVMDYSDQNFYYRATPIIARQLLKDYECVIKIDADSIICSDLDHIINDKTYDIAAPLNWNKADVPVYGLISVDVLPPTMYLNAGLVAMRSREAVEHWFKLCHNDLLFFNHRYKEQDLLNLMMMYCNYFIKNLDSGDTWNGLISKGEMLRLQLNNKGVFCPPATDGFPNKPMQIAVIHLGGGNTPGDKFDYLKTHCTPEIYDFLRGLYE